MEILIWKKLILPTNIYLLLIDFSCVSIDLFSNWLKVPWKNYIYTIVPIYECTFKL